MLVYLWPSLSFEVKHSPHIRNSYAELMDSRHGGVKYYHEALTVTRSRKAGSLSSAREACLYFLALEVFALRSSHKQNSK